MFAVPSAGFVDRIRGGIPAVRKRHGFGAGPAIKGLPSTSVPWISTVFGPQLNGTGCVRVRSMLPGSNDPLKVIVGLIDHVTLPGFIASLNCTVMFAVGLALVSPSGGKVTTMKGLEHAIVNFQGCGACSMCFPGNRSSPSSASFPLVMFAVYV